MFSPARLFVRALLIAFFSLLLAACGGEEDSATAAPEASQSGPESAEESSERVVWVEGSAVKGAISGGLVTVFRSLGGDTWLQVGERVRTDSEGQFRAGVPDDLTDRVLKVVLSSDSATQMRCDVRPTCRTPGGGSVIFGESFWPGNDLSMTTVVHPSEAPASSAILTPLGSIAYQMASTNGMSGWNEYQSALATLEAEFGLAEGVLSRPQIDLAARDALAGAPEMVMSSLVNAGFLALAEDDRWGSLAEVINNFKSVVAGMVHCQCSQVNSFFRVQNWCCLQPENRPPFIMNWPLRQVERGAAWGRL